MMAVIIYFPLPGLNFVERKGDAISSPYIGTVKAAFL